MSTDHDLPAVPQHYDPVTVFTEVFADGWLAGDLAEVLTCSDVNVLAGLLESRNPTAAEVWLDVHREHCSTPYLH
jgi:hypothetical protein